MRTLTTGNRKHWILFAGLLLCGPGKLSAQGATPATDTTHKHQPGMAPMPGMHAMSGMHSMPGMAQMPEMQGPHHALAMAYHATFTTFARTLQENVTRSGKVDLDLGRTAVSEMRRSFDQMQDQRNLQMAMMTPEMRTSMAGMMAEMGKQFAALGEHLTALETEMRADLPADPGRVSEHLQALLKPCPCMEKMAPPAKPQ